MSKYLSFVIFFMLSLNSFSQVANTQWNTGCLLVGDDVMSSEIQFTTEQMQVTYVAYEQEGCRTPYIIYQENYFYKVNELNMNLQVLSITYQALSDEVARAMNTIAFCGIIDWQKDQVREVAGQVCDDRHLPLKNEWIYSLLEIKDQELQLGEANGKYDGHTEEFRHRQLGELIWVRK